MRYAVIDVETSTHNDANPFSKGGSLTCVGIFDKDGRTCYPIEYGDQPYGQHLEAIQKRLDQAAFVVGANIKFDRHWLRRYGIRCPPTVFDVLLARFILSGQTLKYPSLDDEAARYGFPQKLDVVQTDYWDKGIDTPNIPWEVLEEYNLYDLMLTNQVFLRQLPELRSAGLLPLFKLQCQDLVILEEMEWNGLKYDLTGAAKASEEARREIATIDDALRSLVPGDFINWNSDHHISSILYGGVVYARCRETYERVLKNGTKTVERWTEKPIEFPRLVKPLPRTETKRTRKLTDAELASINQDRSSVGKRHLVRTFQVSEPVLKRLNARGKAQKIIGLLLRRSELEKLESTYFGGLIERHRRFEWPTDTIHGQFNQCVVPTGRLSSSSPNLQNVAGSMKYLFYSRYGDASCTG